MTGMQALVQVVGKTVDVTYPNMNVAGGMVFIGLKGQLNAPEIKALLSKFEGAAS